QRYQAEGKAMGRLAFSALDIEPLGPEAVLARGRFGLIMPDGLKPGGLFTVIFRKFPDGWKIIHDHTSADPPQRAAPAQESDWTPPHAPRRRCVNAAISHPGTRSAGGGSPRGRVVRQTMTGSLTIGLTIAASTSPASSQPTISVMASPVVKSSGKPY